MRSHFWSRWGLPIILLVALPLTYALPEFGIINSYAELVLKYIGINIILAVSLNLVNGYLGEFSVGHAGFMAIGAYTASILTVTLFPRDYGPLLFPIALILGGAAAGLAGLVLSVPSFRTRGDYLAIVTLAFNMIVKSIVENVNALGGPRGFMGMDKLASLTWVYVWVVVLIVAARNFVGSKFGRGVLSIREDETASGLVGVNTQQAKILTFVISAFIAGIAGGLFAHVVQFINPRSFTLLKSTDMLVMVYLGGVGSISGSIVGAAIYTLLLEGLRPLLVLLHISPEWRLVVAPLFLVFLMIFRPRGIMGGWEFPFLRPREPQAQPSAGERAPEVKP
ncbi:MAG: branched-chain amino acid ABC transporter permease [Armatimonadota bacterium]